MAPKCGNTTIAEYLGVDIHTYYEDMEVIRVLQSDEFKKIIIIRNIYDRFISGFYQDLLANTCYNNINITFLNYCLFLKYCFDNKLKNVNNLNVYFPDLNIPIWWGNCSNVYLPITNNMGQIYGHIGSQKYYISNYIKLIKGNNVNILDLKDLNKYLNINLIKNFKTYIENSENIENYKLNILKKHNYLLKLNESIEIMSIIDHIYNEDIIFINELSTYKSI